MQLTWPLGRLKLKPVGYLPPWECSNVWGQKGKKRKASEPSANILGQPSDGKTEESDSANSRGGYEVTMRRLLMATPQACRTMVLDDMQSSFDSGTMRALREDWAV